MYTVARVCFIWLAGTGRTDSSRFAVDRRVSGFAGMAMAVFNGKPKVKATQSRLLQGLSLFNFSTDVS